MAIHAKQKVGRGVVFSLSSDPEKWYYRELIPGTKRYQYRLIPSSTTLEEALANYLVVYDQFRSEGSSAASGTSLAVDGSTHAAAIGKRKGRSTKSIADHVKDYLVSEQQKVEAGLLNQKTWVNKEFILRKHLLGYLDDKGVTRVKQLDDLTFEDYLYYRKDARKLTRQKELITFKVFFETHLLKRKLISSVPSMPKVRIKESELDANPPIDSDNWSRIRSALQQYKSVCLTHNNHRGYYFAMLFYRFCLIARNSGLRPNETLSLRWCDVVRENVGRINSKGEEVEDWIVHIHIRDSKTGKQRTVPCRGVDEQLQQWRDEQLRYCLAHGILHTTIHQPENLIFCNPNNEYKGYCYDNYTRAWRKMMELATDLKSYKFSDRSFTLYSLRTTYINNRILEGKDIYTVAKLAGHTIGVCEKYYARLDLAQKSKEITEVEFGKKGSRKREMQDY